MSIEPIEVPRDTNPPSKGYEAIIANWTRILGISTIFLFIATILNAYVLYRTDLTIKEQYLSNVIQNRAYINFLQTKTTTTFKDDKDQVVRRVDVAVFWKNLGKTPATNFESFSSIGWYPIGSEPDFSKPRENKEPAPLKTVGPDMETSLYEIGLDQNEIQKANAGNGRIIMWGRATYRDAFSDVVHIPPSAFLQSWQPSVAETIFLRIIRRVAIFQTKTLPGIPQHPTGTYPDFSPACPHDLHRKSTGFSASPSTGFPQPIHRSFNRRVP